MSSPLDADRYAHLELELACPTCASAGLIPLEHLDRILFCQGCLATFRVDPLGLVELEPPQTEKISVQVRSSSSGWQENSAVIPVIPSISKRLLAWAWEITTSKQLLWGCACGLIVFVVICGREMSYTPSPPPPLELPTELEERATLVADAVARRDTNLLLRVTDPTQHRALRIWLAHGKELPAETSIADADIKSELLSTAITTATKDHAEARVRLSMPPDGKEFVLSESWIYRGDTWYFQPIRLRSPRPTTILRTPKQR